MSLFRALVLSSLMLPALSAAVGFTAVTHLDEVALKQAPAAERDQYLAWAKAYAHYRKYPNGQSIETQDFVQGCARDTASNLFCELLLPKAENKLPPTPKALRDKYFAAILRLDNAAKRAETCKLSRPALEEVVNDVSGLRLEARSLYWLWVCAGTEKDDGARAKIRERLWRRFPLDHHTFLVLSAENDARIHQRLLDDSDLEVAPTSSSQPNFNRWILGIEALLTLNEYGAAAEVTSAVDQNLRAAEPEVRLYVTALMARVARQIPSVLPVARALVPLIALRPELLNGRTAASLFPYDYPLYDSERGKEVASRDLLAKYADRVEPNLLAGLVYYESAFNPRASSGAHAYGLLQLLLPTATDQYRIDSGDARAVVTREQLLDPRFNLKIGTSLLERLHKNLNSWPLALAAYNAGETGVREWIKAAPKMSDPQVQMDLLFMNLRGEVHVSDYISTVLGKGNWYDALYGN